MPEFELSHGGVDATTESMRAATMKVRSDLAMLENESKRTLQHWSGRAQQAYTTAQQQWSAAAAQMEQQLVLATTRLGTINQNYREADARAASQF